ncbi:serine/arginine repetitive matrix protein 3-like isoform X2 [Schistocerca americana]|uniref:serine/arginine repetitive matrix protein 3-like isoform X2 n=1 Tax=Schistocerca americana TaxID=7009 RepID=UPI001F4FB3B4|nr:serine/arginine repetitive matrix protein 3-like isoform X2 [Schistocerca americana]
MGPRSVRLPLDLLSRFYYCLGSFHRRSEPPDEHSRLGGPDGAHVRRGELGRSDVHAGHDGGGALPRRLPRLAPGRAQLLLPRRLLDAHQRAALPQRSPPEAGDAARHLVAGAAARLRDDQRQRGAGRARPQQHTRLAAAAPPRGRHGRRRLRPRPRTDGVDAVGTVAAFGMWRAAGTGRHLSVGALHGAGLPQLVARGRRPRTSHRGVPPGRAVRGWGGAAGAGGGAAPAGVPARRPQLAVGRPRAAPGVARRSSAAAPCRPTAGGGTGGRRRLLRPRGRRGGCRHWRRRRRRRRDRRRQRRAGRHHHCRRRRLRRRVVGRRLRPDAAAGGGRRLQRAVRRPAASAARPLTSRSSPPIPTHSYSEAPSQLTRRHYPSLSDITT